MLSGAAAYCRERLIRLKPGLLIIVSRVIHTSYAVGSKPGVHLNERPDSPPAGRKISFFFIKMLQTVQHFYEKDKKRTMLPQAVCVSSGETPGLINHRVSRVIHWSPGLSRWDACWDSDILPGTSDPAEAGTPDHCLIRLKPGRLIIAWEIPIRRACKTPVPEQERGFFQN